MPAGTSILTPYFMWKIIGIDLSTNNSALAFMEGGEAKKSSPMQKKSWLTGGRE